MRQAQDRLGRALLIENPSSYLRYRHSTIPEWEFMAELARRSGCGLLLDVNNVYVSARNHGFDARAWIEAIPAGCVGEIHLAGHTVKSFPDGEILIDTHNRPVCEGVWALYRAAAARFPGTPALIEWDNNLPPLEALVAEARRADAIAREFHAVAA